VSFVPFFVRPLRSGMAPFWIEVLHGKAPIARLFVPLRKYVKAKLLLDKAAEGSKCRE
jgi:hypothetical protein